MCVLPLQIQLSTSVICCCTLWLEELVAKKPHCCSCDRLPASLTISANDTSSVCSWKVSCIWVIHMWGFSGQERLSSSFLQGCLIILYVPQVKEDFLNSHTKQAGFWNFLWDHEIFLQPLSAGFFTHPLGHEPHHNTANHTQWNQWNCVKLQIILRQELCLSMPSMLSKVNYFLYFAR